MARHAVLFDLDDTIYDHRFASRRALAWLREHQDSLRSVPLGALEEEYEVQMNALHPLVLAGQFTPQQARTERLRRIFADHGERITGAEAKRRSKGYRAAYLRSERAVPGVRAVVRRLARRGHPLGVVTNNSVVDQRRKLEVCGVAPYLRTMVISQAVGLQKPDPRIFRIALDRLGVEPSETTMVGDSYSSDVVGARSAGITPVWLNRRGLRPPRNDGVRQLTSYLPLEDAVRALLE